MLKAILTPIKTIRGRVRFFENLIRNSFYPESAVEAEEKPSPPNQNEKKSKSKWDDWLASSFGIEADEDEGEHEAAAIGQIPTHLSGDDSTGSFVSCEDNENHGARVVDVASDEELEQLPAHLPVMCDVDAPTVVIQNTLKLPKLAYSSVNSVAATFSVYDADAPTVVIQQTLSLPHELHNPFCEPPSQHADESEDICVKLASPTSSKPSSNNRRRSSLLVHVDSGINVGGISKRRSSCAFAAAPLPPFSPERSRDECSFMLQETDRNAPFASMIAESPLPVSCSLVLPSPLPVVASLASPSPCRPPTSASRRKTIASQSPVQAITSGTPRRRSLKCSMLSPLSSTPGKLDTLVEFPPNAVASPVVEPVAAAPAALSSILESACEGSAAAANSENCDPNLSKKTPEKKKRRLYNPARIPDALLEE